MLLAEAVTKNPQSAALQAEAARWAMDRDDMAAADQAAAKAIELDGDQLLARWIQAERLRMTGQLEEANNAYKWFVDYYNAHEVTDAEGLGWIGLGAAQYAALESFVRSIPIPGQRALSRRARRPIRPGGPRITTPGCCIWRNTISRKPRAN